MFPRRFPFSKSTGEEKLQSAEDSGISAQAAKISEQDADFLDLSVGNG